MMMMIKITKFKITKNNKNKKVFVNNLKYLHKVKLA